MRMLRLCLFLCSVLCAAGVARAQDTVKCSSDDGGRNYCKADTSNGVTLARQISGAACQQGYSWDYDNGGIWVDHGCRGEFALSAGPSSDVPGRSITCSSDDGGRHYCDVDTRGGVALVHQRSGDPCRQGISWGYDERGIWVDNGCRADFALNVSPVPQPYSQPYNNGRSFAQQAIACSSDDGGRHSCPADTRYGVELLRQRSHADCTLGDSWGFDDQGIWVDHGCRADFLAGAMLQDNDAPAPAVEGQTISCSSDDGGRHTCPLDTAGGVQMVKQRSGAPCQQGYSWDFDQRGIWVDHGCRADFLVGADGGRMGRHERACFRSVGQDRANELAQQCRQVSPATHPPCNGENSCKLITDEIRRSCQLLGKDAPGFCDEYR